MPSLIQTLYSSVEGKECFDRCDRHRQLLILWGSVRRNRTDNGILSVFLLSSHPDPSIPHTLNATIDRIDYSPTSRIQEMYYRDRSPCFYVNP